MEDFTRESIYNELRKHPKSARELVSLIEMTIGESRLERIKKAQEICVDYVIDIFDSDAQKFLESYDTNENLKYDIDKYLGRKELGLDID